MDTIQIFPYTDSITHTGTGLRNYEWEWKGTDGSNTTHSHLYEVISY